MLACVAYTGSYLRQPLCSPVWCCASQLCLFGSLRQNVLWLGQWGRECLLFVSPLGHGVRHAHISTVLLLFLSDLCWVILTAFVPISIVGSSLVLLWCTCIDRMGGLGLLCGFAHYCKAYIIINRKTALNSTVLSLGFDVHPMVQLVQHECHELLDNQTRTRLLKQQPLGLQALIFSTIIVCPWGPAFMACNL